VWARRVNGTTSTEQLLRATLRVPTTGVSTFHRQLAVITSLWAG
jgi:hypothetical protein